MPPPASRPPAPVRAASGFLARALEAATRGKLVFVSLFAAFTAATLAMQGHGWLVLVVGLAGGALFVLFWLLVLFWLRAFGARNDRS